MVGKVHRVPAYWLGLRRGAFTCVGWQITLCEPMWQVTPRSSRTSSRRWLNFALTLTLTSLSLAVGSSVCLLRMAASDSKKLKNMKDQNRQRYSTVHIISYGLSRSDGAKGQAYAITLWRSVTCGCYSVWSTANWISRFATSVERLQIIINR